MDRVVEVTKAKILFESSLTSFFQWELQDFAIKNIDSFTSRNIKIPNTDIEW